MKANPFLIGGAAVGGVALAILLKKLLAGQGDPQSRLISTLPNQTLGTFFQGVDKKTAGPAIRAFMPQAAPPRPTPVRPQPACST